MSEGYHNEMRKTVTTKKIKNLSEHELNYGLAIFLMKEEPWFDQPHGPYYDEFYEWEPSENFEYTEKVITKLRKKKCFISLTNNKNWTCTINYPNGRAMKALTFSGKTLQIAVCRAALAVALTGSLSYTISEVLKHSLVTKSKLVTGIKKGKIRVVGTKPYLIPADEVDRILWEKQSKYE